MFIKVTVTQTQPFITPTPQEMQKALNRSLNDVGKMVETKLVKDTSAELGIQQKIVRENISVKRSSFNDLTFEILGFGKTMNLIRFNARKVKEGVSAQVWAGGGRMTVKGAFIGNLGRTIFKRTGKARLPIAPVYGPSIGRAFNREKVQLIVNTFVEQNWDAIITRNLKFYMKL